MSFVGMTGKGVNIAAEFYGAKWAISPQYLATLDGVVSRWLKGANTNDHIVSALEERESRAAAASKYTGDNSQVAVISILGPLGKRGAALQDSSSGVTSMDYAGRMVQQADATPDYCAIVLDFDSPGGTVNGTEEFATIIKNCKKPVIAYVNNMAASAAYWLASQCDTIIMNEQAAQVGSIGVMCGHVDASGWYEQNGLNVTYIKADGSEDKNIAPDNAPLSDEALKTILAELKPLRDNFVQAVKAGRRGKMKTSENVFSGKMYNSKDAIANGLADDQGNMDYAVSIAQKMGAKAQTTNTVTPTSKKTSMKNLAEIFGFKNTAKAEDTEEKTEITTAELQKIEDALAAEKKAAADAQALLDKATADNKKLMEDIAEKDREIAANKAKAAGDTPPESEEEKTARIADEAKGPYVAAFNEFKNGLTDTQKETINLNAKVVSKK